jgi:hypothetical protein
LNYLEANDIKLFTVIILRMVLISYCLGPGRHFQPSQMFDGTAKSLPKRRAPERGSTWVGSGLTRKH